jgi:hypothetical protein
MPKIPIFQWLVKRRRDWVEWVNQPQTRLFALQRPHV